MPSTNNITFGQKLQEIKDQYYHKLQVLIVNRKQLQLSLQEIRKTSIIIAVLETPKNQLNFPCDIRLLEAMESQIKVLLC